jgi:hypothetical protein
MLNKIVLLLFSFFTILFFYSCNKEIVKESDISNLSPSFFECDSVTSTPISYVLSWHPEKNDSVIINISGDCCTGILFSTGWVKDSLISFHLDTKKAVQLDLSYRFSLSAKKYVIHLLAQVDSFDLINRNDILLRDTTRNITKYFTRIFLPLFRLDSLSNIVNNNVLFPKEPFSEINKLPYMKENGPHSPLTIKDYFKISILSDDSVSFFDKSINKLVGKNIIARLNNFAQYKLSLTDTSNLPGSDSLLISFASGAFTDNHKIFISNKCQSSKEFDGEIIAIIGDGHSPVYPEDIVLVHLSYLDKNGVEHKFNKGALFEAGLISGCGAAKILNSKGEKKSFFHLIKEPIRLYMLPFTETDWNDTHISLGIGCYSNGE